MIWLDKTGTITEGDLRVVRWYGDERWRLVVATLEAEFSHPVSRALTQIGTGDLDAKLNSESHDCQRRKLVGEFGSFVTESTNHPGMGVSGTVGTFNVLVGNKKLLQEFGINPNRRHVRIANRILEKGCSPCWVVVNQKVVAIVALGDKIRAGAVEAVDSFRAKGWEVGILSGDHQAVVNLVAEELGIKREFAIGQASPESKLALVGSRKMNPSNQLADPGTVVMVGDGVNDSAALAGADIGIAVKNGASASLMAAPVYLAEHGLAPILRLMAISDSAARTMNVNLVISVAYNILFAGLAYFGFVNPLVAAILMPLSSITVVALSLRAGR